MGGGYIPNKIFNCNLLYHYKQFGHGFSRSDTNFTISWFVPPSREDLPVPLIPYKYDQDLLLFCHDFNNCFNYFSVKPKVRAPSKKRLSRASNFTQLGLLFYLDLFLSTNCWKENRSYYEQNCWLCYKNHRS